MRYFRDKLTFLSRAKFYFWRLLGNRFQASFKMKEGITVFLRPMPYEDLATATEVFAMEAYNAPIDIKDGTVKLIVDLGANVGYSCLYWLNKYPRAKIIAFEPHPYHITQINKNLEANANHDQVILIAKAAGISDSRMYLTNEGASSALGQSSAEGTIAVEVTDWLEQIGNHTNDLLKMDIEGSEYILLSNPRFSQTNIKICVLEWHNNEKYPNGRLWCEEKLTAFGYNVCPGKVNDQENGLLWAWKSL